MAGSESRSDSALARERAIEAFVNASQLAVMEAKGIRSDTLKARKRLIEEGVDETLLAARLQHEEQAKR
jgi:hypothetical protein